MAKKDAQPKPIEEKTAKKPQDNRPTVGVISTICDGEASTSNRKTEPQSKKTRVQHSIAFLCDDLKGIRIPHDDPMVISLVIAKHDVKKVLVDNRSSTDILFYDAFQKMKLPSHQLHPINAPLVRFTKNSI